MAAARSEDGRPADALVVFGITGDLARKMTLRSLYRLERRRLLDTRIVGVAVEDWDVQRLREHAKRAIADAGEQIDEEVFHRLANRLSYVSGDFAEADTFSRLAKELRDAKAPAHYLEVPPSLFATVVEGLSGADLLPPQARVIVEKPFGHDLASARELAASLHRYLARVPALPDRPLPRQDGPSGDALSALRERDARAGLEPAARQQRPDHDGRVLRRRGSRPLLRSRRRAARRRRQPPAADACGGGDGAARRAATRRRSRTRSSPCSTRCPHADPGHYVRGQYEGYRDIDGVAPDSDTETYVALRLEIENWRWAGVPFFIRTGKRLPVTQTELRLVFKHPPRLSFLPEGKRRPQPSQLVVKIDPSTGVRIVLDARRADSVQPQAIELDIDLTQQGGQAPTPYEVLLHAAMQGDSTQFARQDGVEETWRIVEPLLHSPTKVEPYAPGSWGPSGAEALVAGHGGWHEPWVDGER